jgi:MoxR-like ATPase
MAAHHEIRDTIGIGAAKQLLHALSVTQAPAFLWGPPGIGKSDIVKEFAEDLGADLLVLKASEIRPEELLGLPGLREEGFTTYHPLLPLYRLTEEWSRANPGETPRPTVLFLDEMNCAPPDLLASYQYLLLERTVGGLGGQKLRDDVTIVAAGNRTSDGAFVHTLSTPLASRVVHLHLRPSFDDWREWARRNRIRPTILAFLERRRSCFHDFDASRKNETFGCPRTWSMLSDVLSRLEGSPNAVRQAAVFGTVGPSAGTEYLAFERTTVNAPTAEEIRAAPDQVRTFPGRPDVAMATLENLLAAIREDPDRFVDPGLVYISRMAPEYRAIATDLLLNGTGDLPQPVLLRVLTSSNLHLLKAVSADVGRVLAEDAA